MEFWCVKVVLDFWFQLSLVKVNSKYIEKWFCELTLTKKIKPKV
jgi:hypothetical protein